MPPFIGHAVGDHREGILTFLRHASPMNMLSVPVVYSLGVPLLILDVWVTLYQHICFPLFGIARVSRREHFVADRHRLPYLNSIEKLHCAYCGYATGVLSYVREIAARTEQYWCPIKHAEDVAAPHEHYQFFFDYGDGAAYRHGLRALRGQLVPPPPTHRGSQESPDRQPSTLRRPFGIGVPGTKGFRHGRNSIRAANRPSGRLRARGGARNRGTQG